MKSWQDECSQTNLYKVELRKTEYFTQKLDSKQSGKA